MDDKKLFRISDVAKMFHVSTGTLRHYEKAGTGDYRAED